MSLGQPPVTSASQCLWKTLNNNLQRPLFDGTREKKKQGFITTQPSAACCKSQESQPNLGKGRESLPPSAAVAATRHGDMSNSSQMRELGGLVDNLYLSSKNRHHQDVTASAPTTQSRKNTKVGLYICSVQVCPHEGGVASRWRCVGVRGMARCVSTVCVCNCCATERDGRSERQSADLSGVVCFSSWPAALCESSRCACCLLLLLSVVAYPRSGLLLLCLPRYGDSSIARNGIRGCHTGHNSSTITVLFGVDQHFRVSCSSLLLCLPLLLGRAAVWQGQNQRVLITARAPI